MRLVLVALAASLVACKHDPPPPAPPPPAPPPSASTAAAAPDRGEKVDGPTAKKLVASGARLVDVRSAAEFAERHVNGAENVPIDVIERDGLSGDPNVPVVVYCHSGRRSARAAASLRAKGRTVYDLGGMAAWGD